MYERQELRQAHPDFQVPTPPTEPKTVAQREKAMQRQARNSRRKLRMAPQVPSQGVSDLTMDSCEEANRLQPHPDFQVPTPPTKPKTVAQREKDMQRQTRNSRRNLHRAPQVLNQGINDPVMDCCEEADLRLKAGHRPSYVPPGGFSENMPNRYVRNSFTEEERDRALDEHAERIFHQKVNTMMFGEDLSASKLPSKRRSKKVRAPEKIRQLEQERHNAVPFDDEHQLLRVVCTTVMFGDDLSQTRRIPAQSSLVGGRHTRIHDAEGLIGAPMPRSRYQNPEPEDAEDQEDAVYITMEDLDYRANRLKQAADMEVSSERTDSQIPTPPTKPKTVDQREKDMQRQTRNSCRNLRKAPQVHSVNTEEEPDRALDEHADFQVPPPPLKPKTVAQREKDMQRRTCNSRRNLRKAPPVPSQGVSDQTMVSCEEADHRLADPDFQIFSPRTKPKTVDQREKDMQRQTRNSRRNLRKAPPVQGQGVSDQAMDSCEEADRPQAHPEFQVPTPPTKPKTVDQREKDMQRQTHNSRRNLCKAPQVHSVNTEEERDRALDEHADFQVPTPPPKTVAQREKDMQRRTRNSRRNLRKAPPVPSQGVSDQAMVSCKEADRPQAHPDFQVPTPPTKLKTVDQREKDMQRQTRNSRRNLRKAPQVHSVNTEEERDRALDEHSDFQVPNPPPKTVDQREKDMQRRTCNSRRNLRKAPQDPSQGVSDQAMVSCEEADRLQAHPDFQVPTPPTKLKTVDQREKDMQRQTRNSRRNLRKAPQVHSVNTEEERDRALDEHADFQVPNPPPKTVAQREKDMQRRTCNSRRNLRKAPPVPSQGVSDQAMDSCEEADHRQAHPDFQVPTPPTKPKTVAQREKDMQRQTRNSRRNLRKAPQDPSTGISDQVMDSCEEADLRLKAGQRPSYVPPEGFSDNMPNRYVRNSLTEEERDRALDEHAERIFHQKVNTMMFGEDLSTSKLPSKRRSKKVRAPEKIHQLEQERHNAVPFDDEHQLLRVVCTTVMFGDDLSQTRRIPAQSSLVGGRHTRIHDAQGLIGAPMPRSRYQNPEPEPDEDQEDAEYITMEDLDYRANRLKQAADMEVSSERTDTKLSSPAPQRHTATLKRTATDDNISGHSLPMHPQPPVAAKSDNAVAAEKLRYMRGAHVDNVSGHFLTMHPQPPVAAKSDNAVAAEKLSSKKLSRRRTKDTRALKRRYDDPSGPVRSKH
ncbi:Hypp5473 [Branchiostoma lanceolatum]|uniref:Hypp5473 protein n=1 Tax=Branchiostoma lanceolatum TaxID=7740 RepID=A0A8J9VPT6_BRALA|nr:Hypp5473 [Branchiostoma lanceolatum]